MSSSQHTFVSACLAGNALLEDIDDWVDDWHDSDTRVTLDAFLGFNEREGALWSERPEALRFIVAAHRAKMPVDDILQSRDDYALAARAADSSSAASVLQWLRETGRA